MLLKQKKQQGRYVCKQWKEIYCYKSCIEREKGKKLETGSILKRGLCTDKLLLLVFNICLFLLVFCCCLHYELCSSLQSVLKNKLFMTNQSRRLSSFQL